ncbi:oligosaccharide flippase family protein [Halapricum sp. CBA1109]|uniref:lipopolysaccharide biosynthesis protein n=1 Tax=Halapricum sp. CBA1109 TaxID=2668068 RepID=UPI0012FBA5EB|nr:lipopolysaccharide biosynthesis protein [Halapricum sp. CBA1109]MUV88795.1 oligosaccharide flippase family protein [Halapricum sp. CBA1109]
MLQDLRRVSVAETVARGASFVTVPLLTRALTPSSFGLYRSVFVVSSLVLTIRGILNLSTLVEKRLPEMTADDQASLVAAAAATLGAFVGLSVLVVVAVSVSGVFDWVAPGIFEFIRSNVLVVCLFVATTALYQFGLTLSKSLDRFDLYSGAVLVSEVVFLLAVVGLFFTSLLTAPVALGLYVVARGLSIAILLWRLSSVLFARPDFRGLWSSARAISLPLAPQTVVKQAQGKVPDAVVISAFGTAVFGGWSVLFTFSTVFQLFSRPFSTMLLPKLSKRLDEGEGIDNLLTRYYRFATVLVVPMVVGGSLLGTQIVGAVFGPQYRLSELTTATFLIAFGLQTLAVPASPVFVARDDALLDTLTYTVASGLLLGTVALGALFGSITLVAAGYAVQQCTILVVGLWYQTRYVTSDLPTPSGVVRFGIPAVAMTGFVLTVEQFAQGLLSVVVVVSASATLYFGALYGTGVVSKQDIALVRRFVGG